MTCILNVELEEYEEAAFNLISKGASTVITHLRNLNCYCFFP